MAHFRKRQRVPRSDGIAVVGLAGSEQRMQRHLPQASRERRPGRAGERRARSSKATLLPGSEVDPGAVQAAFIVAPKHTALDVVKQCKELGIRRVWIHGSSALPGVLRCRRLLPREGIRVIAGACP